MKMYIGLFQLIKYSTQSTPVPNHDDECSRVLLYNNIKIAVETDLTEKYLEDGDNNDRKVLEKAHDTVEAKIRDLIKSIDKEPISYKDIESQITSDKFIGKSNFYGSDILADNLQEKHMIHPNFLLNLQIFSEYSNESQVQALWLFIGNTMSTSGDALGFFTASRLILTYLTKLDYEIDIRMSKNIKSIPVIKNQVSALQQNYKNFIEKQNAKWSLIVAVSRSDANGYQFADNEAFSKTHTTIKDEYKNVNESFKNLNSNLNTMLEEVKKLCIKDNIPKKIYLMLYYAYRQLVNIDYFFDTYLQILPESSTNVSEKKDLLEIYSGLLLGRIFLSSEFSEELGRTTTPIAGVSNIGN